MYFVVIVTFFDFDYYWLSLCLVTQIFTKQPVPKNIIYMSGIGFELVLLYFQTKANIVTAITKRHTKWKVQMLYS